MANGGSEHTPVMQEAIARLRRGDTVGAEAIVVEAARAAEATHGRGSPAHAIAQNELGTILINVGERERAVKAFREACLGEWPRDEAVLRDRLTFLMNLGHTLEMMGDLDEAERVLRTGLQGREAFYGKDHAGYAFGLEPLATVMLAKGEHGAALAMFEETVRNFWANGHPRIAGTVALRAEAYAAAGDGGGFADVEALPDELVREAAKTAVGRIGVGRPEHVRGALAALAGWCARRLGPDDPTTLSLWTGIANHEQPLGREGDLELRIAAIREVLASAERTNDVEQRLTATLGLALAMSDAGRADEGLGAYDHALELVRGLDDRAAEARVLRNRGLMLAEMERREEAARALHDAVAAADAASDEQELGLASVALGIFLQHGKELTGAEAALARGIELLEPAHPDAVCARSHLDAIRRGDGCGCGDQRSAIADAFRAFVLDRLPADLLERFEVALADGDFQIEVHLARKPAQDELENLNRVINHALHEFREKLGA